LEEIEMADGTTSAFIAASATLVTAFLTQFLAEAYKRFKDGSAIAAGISGELSSYVGGADVLIGALNGWISGSKAGTLDRSGFRTFEKPIDVYFEKVVGKIGVLGRVLTEDIVFVYSHLRAFRSTFGLILGSHNEMSPDEFQARCGACIYALQQADSRGKKLMPMLHARAEQNFLMAWYPDKGA
jgi:hypothetical protein